ncbi:MULTISPECIES: DUF4288 domain-containing protein [unclassified Kitasatospora]|uniref:DUF4288 domain-containing protein n=1 Tax=unclassified Kitasatospora TaxID=2633591 RepID=UPI0007108F34|nr:MULTISPECIES: DUF4288 domain-containing protein [unclassified Kitasatospora]
MTTPDGDWFSCRLRFAHYSDNDPTLSLRISSYLLRALDFDDAKLRAIEIGKREEKVYANAAGGMARVALVEVEAVDILDAIVDGVEVASIWPEEITPCPYSWDHQFSPEASRPTNSL